MEEVKNVEHKTTRSEESIKWVKFLSWMVILFFALNLIMETLKLLKSVIKVDTYFDESFFLNHNEMFGIHSSILMSSIMLLYLSIFRKNIQIYMVALILLFNRIIPTYEFMEFVLAKQADLWGLFAWRKAGEQVFVNPQWLNVYLLLFGILILLIQVFFKKYRTMDKLFSLFISLSVVVTLILFHGVVVFGYYKFQRENQINMLVRQVKNESRENYCKERMCVDIKYNDEGYTLLKENDKDNSIEEYVNHFSIIKFLQENKSSEMGVVNGWYIYNPNSISGGFEYYTFAMKKIDKNTGVFVLDRGNKVFGDITVFWFSFLAGIAHSIWILGGYSILFFHKEYLFKRKKMIKIIEKEKND